MKRDFNIVQRQAYSTLYSDAAVHIATECFVKALPLSVENDTETKGLIGYANDVYRRLGVDKMIGTAIESHTGNVNASVLLKNLHHAIESVAKPASKRIADAVVDGEADPSDVMKFNAEEIRDFSQKRKDLRVDEVAEIVKKKVIDTIKSEKAEHLRSEKLREEIREVISEDTEEAVEAYMNILLKKDEPRQHISLFSRIQDVCLEALINNDCAHDTELPYELLAEITLESLFATVDEECNSTNMSYMLKFLDTVVKNTQTSPEAAGDKVRASMDNAMACTICVLTIFEVLKTMNIYSPTTDDIKTFISKNPQVHDIQSKTLSHVHNELVAAGINLKKLCSSSQCTADAVTAVYNTLNNTSERLLQIANTNNAISPSLMQACNDEIAKQLNLISAWREKSTNDASVLNLGYYAQRELDSNVANLTKYLKMISRNPFVNIVEIRYDASVEAGSNDRAFIDIYGIGKDSNPVNNYMMQVTLNPAFGPNLNSIMSLLLSQCGERMKPVQIYHTNTQKIYNSP